MKKLLPLFSLILISLLSGAQNSPAFRQFYFNPYLFNPAFAGIDGYTDVFAFHRQQWVNFNNAPTASGFNIQYPTQNKVALGFNFTTQEVVGLRNTTALLTLAYRIPISANQFLFFGLSGGMGSNDLDLEDVDYSNDPTILNASTSSIYADGNFGALYVLGRLRIGFSLPNLFANDYFSPQELGDTQYSQFRNQLYSASYKFNLGSSGNFAFEPYFLYRLNRDNQNFWEGSGLVYYKDQIWIGASYNETLGVGFFLGMDFKEKVRIGYSYELPPVSDDFISANSHEIHVRLRLGKKKIFKWANRFERSPSQVAKSDPQLIGPVTEEALVVKEKEPEAPRIESQPTIQPAVEKVPAAVEEPNVEESPPVETEAVILSPPRQPVLTKGYYVIVASFSVLQNANREKVRFVGYGFSDAFVAQSPINKLYYVYIFSSGDLEVARQARDNLRKINASKNAWVLTIV